jgi:hypothetical protein
MNTTENKLLQRALRELVAPTITVDGIFGNQTTQAIKLYATQNSTTVENALTLLQQYVREKYVNDDAYKEAAKSLGVPVSYVRAVSEVETAGESFLPDGRMKVLFERHWFYRKLKEAIMNFPDKKAYVGKMVLSPGEQITVDNIMAAMVRNYSNICNPERGGYLGDGAEWGRLNSAMKFDIEAACQSASYGAYQIMGFNCVYCGYKTAHDMMDGLAHSESKQLMAMVSFVKSQPAMLACLKRGDWAGFAEKYNGPAYKTNSYDIKLAKGEEKWRTANLA